MRVSRQWAILIKNTPQAWSTLFLRKHLPRNVDSIESWFKKSGCLPINIHSWPSQWGRDCQAWDRDWEASDITQILERYRSRLSLFCDHDIIYDIFEDNYHNTKYTPRTFTDESVEMPELTILTSSGLAFNESVMINAPKLKVLMSLCTIILSCLTLPTLRSLVRLHIILETTELSRQALISLHMAPNLETFHVSVGTEHFEWAEKTPCITLPALKSLHLATKEPKNIEEFYKALDIPRLSTLTVVDINRETQLFQLADTHGSHLSFSCLELAHTFIFSKAIGNLTVLELTHTKFDDSFFEGLKKHQLATPTLHKIVLVKSYPVRRSAVERLSECIELLTTGTTESNGKYPGSNIQRNVTIRCSKRWSNDPVLNWFKPLKKAFPQIVELIDLGM
jgi:hypothetical protein